MAKDMVQNQLKLELQGITKKFGEFTALKNASFTLRRGEVHALLGENGAGKSTLMNVVCGLYAPDSGEMVLNGAPAVVTSPAEAHQLGIGMVHQHYKLVERFTALENIQLENGSGAYQPSMRQLRKRAQEVATRLGFAVDLDKRVVNMSVSEQQRVEILKILTADASLLILDEPTAVLTDAEADKLFSAMRTLAQEGATIVFVTHKLREALTFADRITVMRGGEIIRTLRPDECCAADLTTMIVGEKIVEAPALSAQRAGVKLGLRHLSARDSGGRPALRDLSLDVRAGEIYGIAGVGGNGQDELTAVLTGLLTPENGSIAIAGTGEISQFSPRQRRAAGLVCIYSDRAQYGLANELSITENYGIEGVLAGEFGPYAWVNRAKLRAKAKAAISRFDVLGVRALHQKTGLLSGGNAQKLVIAREFSHEPEVVIAHSPCRGLDIRASAAVHSRLRAARDRGAAVILISEDLDEVLLMSDRIGVISRGRITAEFDAPASRTEIGNAMVGHG